jgi:hypothetical protein
MILTASATMANDENMPDTLIISKVQVEKGAKIALTVEFFNDQELAALTIPLSLVGGLYLIDSVSFVGSRVEYLKMRPVTIAENRTDIVFGAICMTEDYIAPGRGLMATLHLSPAKTAKSDFCVVDTTTIGPASVLFTKVDSKSFVPEFTSGMVSFKEAPKEEATGKEVSDKESADKKDE